MVDFLIESGNRANRPPIANTLMWGANAKYQEDLKVMNELVDERPCSSLLACCLRKRLLMLVCSDSGTQGQPD